ncbi:MarR family transcriptional regulator [Archangium violaceum]|uniref:MarR family winged helix-turn-helix transcriptional regulator n=1 Tax=Archangium violaceum TaxID=83451 RepID=UPI00194FC2C0|nr:MarR family transcriptional regulator [Archangium violaceum]QRN99182.1 MarR family transcriptional regulator [Archangium violaceum]
MTRPRTGNEVVDALIAASHRMRQEVNERLRECGLSLARFKVLQLLEKDALRMKEVSEALGVVPRTLTDTVDGLEAEGLVKREEDPNDRRATRLRLTAAGLNRVTEAHGIMGAVHRERTSRLSAGERAQLIHLLERLSGD